MKTLFASLLTAALVLFTTQAASQVVGLHLVSYHPQKSETPNDPNNVNLGAYVKFESGVVVGGYRNTLRRTSLYAGYSLDYGPFSVLMGMVSGYQKKIGECRRVLAWEPYMVGGHAIYQDFYKNECDYVGGSNGKLTLMLAPSVVLPGFSGFSPRISVIPRVNAATSTVVHLSVERAW